MSYMQSTYTAYDYWAVRIVYLFLLTWFPRIVLFYKYLPNENIFTKINFNIIV